MTDKKKVKPSDLPKFTQAELAVLSEKSKKFDGEASSEDCVRDLRKLQRRNPLKFITRNFYRINGKYSDATWNQHFGTFLEFRRQAGLELSRNQHAIERQVAKHASVDVYRKFYKEEVLPFHQKYNWANKESGRYKTILTGSDFHDTEVDRFCLDVFLDVAARIQPSVICLNGDLFDNYEFSRFNIDIRNIRIKPRFDFVKSEILGRLRKSCPKSQIDLIIGNHEYRLLKHLADRSPAMRVLLSDVMGLGLKDLFGLDEFGVNLVAKFDLAAFTTTDRDDELKENYQVYYDCFVAHHYKNLEFGLSGASGHTHRPEQITFRNYPMGRLIWTTTGAMAQTDAEYVDEFCPWQNSFLIAHVDRKEKKVNHNHVLIPSDFVVVEGKLYTRKHD